MEGIISFISTTAVRPASPEELTKRIELTPWDLHVLLLGPITRGILFLKPTPGPEENGLQTMTAIVDHLNTSLSRTLDFFYPLDGCLGTTVTMTSIILSFRLFCYLLLDIINWGRSLTWNQIMAWVTSLLIDVMNTHRLGTWWSPFSHVLIISEFLWVEGTLGRVRARSRSYYIAWWLKGICLDVLLSKFR